MPHSTVGDCVDKTDGRPLELMFISKRQITGAFEVFWGPMNIELHAREGVPQSPFNKADGEMVTSIPIRFRPGFPSTLRPAGVLQGWIWHQAAKAFRRNENLAAWRLSGLALNPSSLTSQNLRPLPV